MEDVDERAHTHTAMALRRGRVTNPMLGCHYPWGKPPVLIYKRLNGPQDQSVHEEVKKNLHPGSNPGATVQPIAKCLAT